MAEGYTQPTENRIYFSNTIQQNGVETARLRFETSPFLTPRRNAWRTIPALHQNKDWTRFESEHNQYPWKPQSSLTTP